MSQALFSRKMFAVTATVAVLSFLAFLVLLVFGDAFRAPASHGTDGYSGSAIGHRAFARLVGESGIAVTTSRHDSARRANGSLLVVSEPDLEDDVDRSAERLFRAMIERAGPTLVVLPRRAGTEDFAKDGFVRATSEHSTDLVRRVLAPIDRRLELVRRDPLADPIDARDWGPNPTLSRVVQLLRPSPHLEPLITVGADVLFGRVIPEHGGEASEVYVLSDPDLVATHGLVRGSNAVLAVSLVARILPAASGAVVFDETLHGYDVRPNLWEELFRAPLLFATISALLTGLVLVGAGIGRFGRPKALPPAIAPGKRFLVDHTAELLRQGGHSGHALERYLAASIQDAGRALHAPASLDAKGLREWLRRGEGARSPSTPLADLEESVADAARSRSPRTVIEAALAVHSWREATTHGPRGDS